LQRAKRHHGRDAAAWQKAPRSLSIVRRRECLNVAGCKTDSSWLWWRTTTWNLELGINDFVQKSRCTYPDQTLKQLLTSSLIRSLLICSCLTTTTGNSFQVFLGFHFRRLVRLIGLVDFATHAHNTAVGHRACAPSPLLVKCCGVTVSTAHGSMQESCVSVCRETANRLPALLPDPSRVWWSEGTQCPFHSFLVLHSLHSLTSALTPPHARRGALACHGDAQRRALCGPFSPTRECIAQNHPSELRWGG